MRGPVGSLAGGFGVIGTLLPSFSFWMARASDLLGLLPIGCERPISHEGPLGRPPTYVRDNVSRFLAEGRHRGMFLEAE